MFSPPYCPNRCCASHLRPRADFFRRDGTYRTKSKPRPIPRFVCRDCGKGFSRQTFRVDYCDNKPWLNSRVFEFLCSGIGYRQTARRVGMTTRNVELKGRKVMRHARDLHLNLLKEFPDDSEFALDELETFEGCRSTRPVTVPILIHQQSMLLIDVRCETLPPRRQPARRRRRRRGPATVERDSGGDARKNRSRVACRQVLETLRRHTMRSKSLHFRTDRKTSYPGLLKEAFGYRFTHLRIHSRQRRDTSNPLHRINLMLAKSRDLIGRIRRRSWLFSKHREFLELHLMAFACYRNFVEARFNGDAESPAQMLGIVPRRLSLGEVLSWRQDHGQLSINPIAAIGRAA